MHQKNGNGTFTSKIGFVLAAVGSAVGMGNIWMFPYRTGQYGGAAFLIPYLLFIALFSYVGLSGEFAFGRMTGTGPIGSYEFAMKSRGKKGGAILGAAERVRCTDRLADKHRTGAVLHGNEQHEFFQCAVAHPGYPADGGCADLRRVRRH